MPKKSPEKVPNKPKVHAKPTVSENVPAKPKNGLYRPPRSYPKAYQPPNHGEFKASWDQSRHTAWANWYPPEWANWAYGWNNWSRRPIDKANARGNVGKGGGRKEERGKALWRDATSVGKKNGQPAPSKTNAPPVQAKNPPDSTSQPIFRPKMGVVMIKRKIHVPLLLFKRV